MLGFLSDKFSFTLVMLGSAIVAALFAFLLWGFASTLALTLLFAAFFGATAGGFSAAWPNAAQEVANKVKGGLAST